MNIKITKAVVVVGKLAADKVYLTTELPPSLYPYTDPPELLLVIAHKTGEQYVKDNLPDVPTEIITR